MMAYLRQKHSSICRQWFADLEPTNLESGLLKINTTSTVHRNYLQKHCADQFREAAQAATGALVSVQFISDDGRRPERARAVPAMASHGSGGTAAALAVERPVVVDHATDQHRHLSSLDDSSVICPDYSFNHFVTGPGNHLAYAASVAVGDQPGKAYNPLFIHGGVGLGKTHLLHAICQSVLNRDPQTRVCYLSCDTFTNHFLECVQRGRMPEFRQMYRQVDILAIDDIQFLANRERTQEEFFHTFNALYQANRQIVMTSDSPPAEIPQLEERLVSRFKWGLVTDITVPDQETRAAIVRAKAELRGIDLPQDVIEYIASSIDSNARELEGAINTIQGNALLLKRPIDIGMAREALGDQRSNENLSQVTLQHIIDAVTTFYNVKLSDLQSKRRHKSITGPRQLCMWLARKRTRFSLEEIGCYFGGRDHTTVMHSIKTIDKRTGADASFARQVEQIDDQICRHARMRISA